MAYNLVSTTESFVQADRGVRLLTMESALKADVIAVFRNILPSVKNYVSDTITEFKASDNTDFNFLKASASFASAEKAIGEINFVNFEGTVLQTPEGFTDRYIPYLEWLIKYGIRFINEAEVALGAYYKELAIFISSKDAKTSLKDQAAVYKGMEKALSDLKDGLGEFFNSRTSNALRTAGSLFDRGADIKTTIELTKTLNRHRTMIKTKEIMSLTTQIAGLINMLVESTEKTEVPDVSGAAATSIATGAMTVAHYVEFVGVLRYRIEEVINAVGLMSAQVVRHSTENK